MAATDIFTPLSSQAVTVALATTRIAVAFMILPLFSSETVPALVRNAIFVALAIITIVIQPEVSAGKISELSWLILFLKEVIVGLAIGFLFGIYLWAFETAGMIVDTQIGISMAQVMDPLSGHQTTLIGEFLGRFTNYIFITAGGLMLLVGVLLESYHLWPINQVLPDIRHVGVGLFEAEFGNFFRLTLLIASPMLVVIFLVDSVMGLINRYAQQFNVFFISISLKMLAAISVLVAMIFILADLLISELVKHAGAFPEVMYQLFR